LVACLHLITQEAQLANAVQDVAKTIIDIFGSKSFIINIKKSGVKVLQKGILGFSRIF
jgi:hypothetical protein